MDFESRSGLIGTSKRGQEYQSKRKMSEKKGRVDIKSVEIEIGQGNHLSLCLLVHCVYTSLKRVYDDKRWWWCGTG